jgi:hypothetical protein
MDMNFDSILYVHNRIYYESIVNMTSNLNIASLHCVNVVGFDSGKLLS